jgi:thiol-disulfide isomerase/thioredoxin
MKATLVVILFAGVLFLLWSQYSDFLGQGRRPPEAAQILNKIEKEGVPNFSMPDIKGQPVSLEQFKGKLVVLNFWASWCDPCIAEFPSLMSLVARYKGDVVLLAVSADYEMKDIETFLRAFKIESPHVYIMWDKDFQLAKQFGTYKLPESYIIGRKGELIRKVAGVDDWATKDAFEYFDHLLKTSP